MVQSKIRAAVTQIIGKINAVSDRKVSYFTVSYYCKAVWELISDQLNIKDGGHNILPGQCIYTFWGYLSLYCFCVFISLKEKKEKRNRMV